MHTENPFCRVWWARVDKWQRQFARWMIMESSRNFSCDTCLSKFAQGWVRDHQSPSGIKNYQREDTNQNPRSWLTPYNHLYMDPSSQRSRGWNFVSCKEVLLVSWWNIIVLGDLSFSWGEEGLSCWEDDAGSNQWVVILSSNLYINKAIQVFLHIHVCLIV